MQVDYDAVVIGGGPAGASAATVLAAAGWRVALLERSKFPRRKVCGEYLSWTNWASLRRLGVWDAFDRAAGPAIQRVALFGQHRTPATSLLPAAPRRESTPWGRALTRDRLDTLLLQQAQRQGATVHQPCSVSNLVRHEDRWEVTTKQVPDVTGPCVLTSRVVLLACGSWQPAPWQESTPRPAQASDLFGFKAHFTDARLPPDLMPLLAFPGGYGGMVTCQDRLTSLSCCVRRDVVESLRYGSGAAAGEAVLQHICASIPAAADILGNATRQHAWLAAGPIRPGQRTLYHDGLFRVGNAAGEAHPVVAEGISMAIQSGLLAAACLVGATAQRHDDPVHLDEAGRRYRRAWKQRFATRIRVSTAIAALAMRPGVVRWSEPLVQRFPTLLTLGATLAGKARSIPIEEL